MKTLNISLWFAIMTLVASTGLAKNYGSAGCGLGTLVVGKDGSQVLGATTNGTSGSQTFGITSGTSNCIDSSSTASRNQLPLFLDVNRAALANDVARGSGETLAHVSHALGCRDNAKFGSVMQKNFNSVFPNQSVDGASMNASIISVIKHDQDLASTCNI